GALLWWLADDHVNLRQRCAAQHLDRQGRANCRALERGLEVIDLADARVRRADDDVADQQTCAIRGSSTREADDQCAARLVAHRALPFGEPYGLQRDAEVSASHAAVLAQRRRDLCDRLVWDGDWQSAHERGGDDAEQLALRVDERAARQAAC